MSPSTLSNLLLALANIEETTPFGPEYFVHKVGGKNFAFHSPMEDPIRLKLGLPYLEAESFDQRASSKFREDVFQCSD